MYQKENALCKKCKGLLFDYVSDNTKQKQSQWIEEHLAYCPSCKKEYDEICLMLSVLAEEPKVELPAEFQLSLHRKLVAVTQERETEKTSSWLHRLKDMRGMRTVVPALMCLVLVIGVFSSGLFADWQNADSVIVGEPKQTVGESQQIVAETQPPVETPIPSAEETTAPKQVAPKQTPEKTAEPKNEPVQEGVAVKDVQVAQSVEEENGIAVAAETTEHDKISSGSSRAVMMAEEAMQEVSPSYMVKIPQAVSVFLEEAELTTAVDWTVKAVSGDATNAVLCLSESEWEIFSAYIQSLNLSPTLLCSGDADLGITVTIQGIEG